MNEQTELPKTMQLVPVPQQGVARIEADPLETVGKMLAAVIERGITSENAAAAGEVIKLFERLDAKRAAKEFAKAFAAMQAEMPNVQAMRAVPNNDGTTRYKFAPYEDLWKQVQPILNRHGFSVSFNQASSEGKITMKCTLMHVSGHSQTNEFSCRIGKGPPSSSESQADGAASSYAQRGALCDALNIVVRHDSDARSLGGTITPEQAAHLKARVKATGSDEAKFLAYAQAATFESIPETMFRLLDEFLAKRERIQQKGKT